MRNRIAPWLALAALVAAGTAVAAPPAVPSPHLIGLRVMVDAVGKVQSAKVSHPTSPPALAQIAEELAGKLVLAPASRNGVAVPSETSISLSVGLAPRADGQFGAQLKRAYTGPGVLEVGRMEAPKRARENGGLIVVSVEADADGRPDMATLRTEKVEMRVPSAFHEARYMDAIHASLRGSRFQLDTVGGQSVRSRLTVPYLFGTGPAKPKPGEGRRRGASPTVELNDPPVLTAVSTDPAVVLPKLDYRAPVRTTAVKD